MSDRYSTQSVCERIKAINWPKEADFSKQDLHLTLMKEYLRRVGLWAKALNCETFSPFFDIPEQIDPLIPANLELLEWLEAYTEQRCLGSRIHVHLKRMLHWAALHDAGVLKDFNLPNPYELLLRLYEEGAEFRLITGFIEINLAGAIPVRNWLRFSEEPPFYTDS